VSLWKSAAAAIEANNKADRQIAADGQPIDCGHEALSLAAEARAAYLMEITTSSATPPSMV